MLKNMKMRAKLILGFGLVIIVMIGLAGYSFTEQAAINRHLDDIINTHFATLTLVDEINIARVQLSQNVSDFVAASTASEIEKLYQSMQNDIQTIQTNITKLQTINTETETLKPLADLNASFARWLIIYNEEVGLKNAKKQKELVQSFNTKGKEAFALVAEKVANIAESTKKRAADAYQNALAMQKSAATITIILNILGIAFAVLFAFVIGENIVRPIKQLVANLEEVANGNLQKHGIDDKRKDEIGMLIKAFESFLDRFREQISEMNKMVLHLAASANEMSATSAQLGSSASETAASVMETATTTEEIRQVAQTTKDLAGTVTASSDQSYALSKESMTAILQMGENVQKIKNQMDNISQSLLNLSEQSQMIAEIIAAVDEIAEQSNLLAVNAAIEAAKAGEHGKGFAVVAQEVKSLADQSKQSTRQVRKILTDIQKATSGALMAVEQGNKEMQQSAENMNQVDAAMRAIADSLSKSVQLVQQIAYAVEQQFTGIDQINSAMNNVKTASAQNADAARNLEQVAASISDSGNKLKSFIEVYKL
ncbi:MAG: methyl-accepting chemotaxis protein [Spirochaetota bacterium]